MPKTKTTFICTSCGSDFSRWVGKCPDCGSWDSLEEHRNHASASKDSQRGTAESWLAEKNVEAKPLSALADSANTTQRLSTGLDELNRVLGGGLVPGSTTLVGGEPGIGKSTLLAQAAGGLAEDGSRVLYVTSEESAEQVGARCERLNVATSIAASERMFVMADTNLARIVEQVRQVSPQVVIIDSIQMVYKGDMEAGPGSIAQLRRCAQELAYLAKASGAAIVLVGHVTKDGSLAGPRLLEHLVDAVLTFEGDRYHDRRLIRAIKNRYGTTQELGIFEMTGSGLREEPGGASVAALESNAPKPGSVVCPIMTGTRCVLAEAQALTATGFLGAAKRKASSIDSSRLAMLIAVLEQHAGLRLADRDIFAQAVGGVRIAEPAADLALLLAIAGANAGTALNPATCAVGEVGLGGEVRGVTQLETRLREAARLGYTRAIVPTNPDGKPPSAQVPNSIKLDPVPNIQAAIEHLGHAKTQAHHTL